MEYSDTVFYATNYNELMRNRITKVLLICSTYDAYTLEEDGRLDTQMTKEYLDLNISNPPSFKRVSTAHEAFELMEHESFDLIITMLNIGQMNAFDFAHQAKKLDNVVPIVLLTHFSREISFRLEKEDTSNFDYVFCWMGNTDLILAIIKLIEDKRNAENDILETGVQAILLVEDSIKYFSTYLPLIYKLILQQSSTFLSEALNEQQMMMRRRARPKILLATTYSEAEDLYRKYSSNLLGIISDVSFKYNKNSKECSDGGLELCRMIHKENPLMPFILQSSKIEIKKRAEEIGAGFVNKYSKTLLLELSDYITREFSFGDFIFRSIESGQEIARASNLTQLYEAIKVIDIDTLLYHTGQNHLSKWMFARGLFAPAQKIKDVRNEEFEKPEGMRLFVLRTIRDYISILGQGAIALFDENTYNPYIRFARMGEGSLGGKARGLAFINSLLLEHNLYNKYENVRISIPRTVVIATDYFDEFIRSNGLKYVISSDADDADILAEFTGARLPEKLVQELRAYIRHCKVPIAVRSSSKLEDSYYQPFAGIYSTYMVPNCDNSEQMLRLLGKAIKSVYASVYFASSRSYILATSNVLAEEKMAVIIQELCGSEDNGYFFPTLSGVARSVNYYPIEDEQPNEGVANIGLGLGKLVVEGGQSLRFSPKHPKKVLQLSTPELTLRDTQRYMYALDMRPEKLRTSTDDGVNIEKIDISKAGTFRNMKYVSSTWDRQNQRISDSFFTEGRKIVTFSNILKYDSMPLAEIISELLERGCKEMSNQVEIEFAVNMDVKRGLPIIFKFLQIRPIVEEAQSDKIDWDGEEPQEAIIYAKNALGLGRIRGIRDVIYVKPESFDSMTTPEIGRQIEAMNTAMRERGKNYLLVGPGRWGTSDPALGIPIKWSDISEARTIVECGLENYRIDPSQGTHFFQNLTSFGVGYMTINPHIGDGVMDYKTLDEMEAVSESEHVRHVRFSQPLFIFVDGRNNCGIVRCNKR